MEVQSCDQKHRIVWEPEMVGGAEGPLWEMGTGMEGV